VNRLCDKRWNYANVNLMQSKSGTCCLPPTIDINQDEIDNYGTDVFVNHPKLKNARLEMFKGIESSDCSTCWKLEKQNAPSMRGNSEKLYVNKIFSKSKQDGTLDTVCKNIDETSNLLYSNEIELLEITIGNTCDLKCVYCNKFSSSQWALEDYKNNEITKEEFKFFTDKTIDPIFEDTFWKWYNTTVKQNVKHINIKGGEPLVIPYFYTIMEKILQYSEDSNNFDFTIITNLNTSIENRLDLFFEYIVKLQKHKRVNVYISMESMFNKAEYIRSGLNWNQFEKNLHRLLNCAKENKNIHISFMPTINILNISSLPKFVTWVDKLQKDYNLLVTCKCNIADYIFSPLYLPDTFSKYTDQTLKILKNLKNTHYDWNKFYMHIEGIHNIILKNKKVDLKKIQSLKHYLTNLDIKRNTDYKEIFNEYLELFEVKHAS